MSVTTFADRTLQSKTLPENFFSGANETWTRNSEWYTIPTVSDTTQVFYGLVAVFPDSTNPIALTVVSTGTITIDWGDGTTTNPTSNTIASKLYNYTDTGYTVNSTGTLGYKQALVTITSTGNISSLQLNKRHASFTTVHPQNWLDMTICLPNMTTMTFGESSVTSRFNYLERVRLQKHSPSNPAITGTNLFYNLRTLRKVEFGSTVLFNGVASMFNNCHNLTEIDNIGLFGTGQSAQGMFTNCHSLISSPSFFGIGVITNISSMFSACYSLKNANIFNDRFSLSAGSQTSVFNNCSSLVDAPYINTAGVTSMLGFFGSCFSLKTVPTYNTSSVTSMGSMFSNCYSLESVPRLNCSALTNTNSMFSSCFSLKAIPDMDLSKVTNAVSMFTNCSALRTIPALNLSAATTLNAMFSNCSALISIGTLTTSTALTNLGSLFSGDNALVNPPTITVTSAVTTTSGMFNNCYSLITAPTLNMASVTDCSQMFANCSALQNVPVYTLSSGTTITATSMFNSCFGLRNIPAINFVSGTPTFTTIFTNCGSLCRVQIPYINNTISFASCSLGAAELNEIYTNASSSGAGKTITVTGNWGTATDTPSIATAKGWTVTG